MTDNRFSDAWFPIQETVAEPRISGFLLLPAPVVDAGQASPLVWLYQQMYERAAQAHQPAARTRELFSIMN